MTPFPRDATVHSAVLRTQWTALNGLLRLGEIESLQQLLYRQHILDNGRLREVRFIEVSEAGVNSAEPQRPQPSC